MGPWVVTSEIHVMEVVKLWASVTSERHDLLMLIPKNMTVATATPVLSVNHTAIEQSDPSIFDRILI